VPINVSFVNKCLKKKHILFSGLESWPRHWLQAADTVRWVPSALAHRNVYIQPMPERMEGTGFMVGLRASFGVKNRPGETPNWVLQTQSNVPFLNRRMT
jgi:hypothetical protein